jgi:hypothetical protein
MEPEEEGLDQFDVDIHNAIAGEAIGVISTSFATPEESMLCAAHISAGVLIARYDDRASRMAAFVTFVCELPSLLEKLDRQKEGR